MTRTIGALWFIAGLLVAALALRVDAQASAERSILLVRSTCAQSISVVAAGDRSAPRHVTFREPGLYRLVARDDDSVRTGSDERPVAELPLGPGGELQLPASWCAPNGGGLIGPGLGP